MTPDWFVAIGLNVLWVSVLVTWLYGRVRDKGVPPSPTWGDRPAPRWPKWVILIGVICGVLLLASR